jgi:hypothetical protein
MKAKRAELDLLKMIFAAGGAIAASDDRLAPFEFDAEPDSLENCVAFGWLRTARLDAGGMQYQLTQHGRNLIEGEQLA